MTRAGEHYDQALALQQRLSPSHHLAFKFPGNSLIDTADALHNLGHIRECRGERLAALNCYGNARRIREEVQPQSLQLSDTLLRIGMVYRDRHSLERACEHFQTALDIRLRCAPQTLDAAEAWTLLARVHQAQGLLDDAMNGCVLHHVSHVVV